jgi:hypothetical protein
MGAILIALRAIGVWIGTCSAEIFPGLRLVIANVVGWMAYNVVGIVAQKAIAISTIVGWGAFLLIVTTGFDSLHLMSILTTNPLTGMPGDMYQLFCAVFPFQFLMRLVVAYILWNLTFQAAAITVMRGLKFLFGS